jgi:hypothetical protein
MRPTSSSAAWRAVRPPTALQRSPSCQGIGGSPAARRKAGIASGSMATKHAAPRRSIGLQALQSLTRSFQRSASARETEWPTVPSAGFRAIDFGRALSGDTVHRMGLSRMLVGRIRDNLPSRFIPASRTSPPTVSCKCVARSRVQGFRSGAALACTIWAAAGARLGPAAVGAICPYLRRAPTRRGGVHSARLTIITSQHPSNRREFAGRTSAPNLSFK